LIALPQYDLDLLLCSKIEPRFIALIEIKPGLNCLGTSCLDHHAFIGSEKSTRLPNAPVELRAPSEKEASRQLQPVVGRRINLQNYPKISLNTQPNNI
jgi:hypothetical protein